METKQLEKDFLNNWKQCNKVTVDILKSIPDNFYNKKPFGKRFTTFAWEFSCILTTREMYMKGLNKGELNGETEQQPMSQVEKLTKNDLIKKLESTNKNILKVINNNEIKGVKFFGNKTNKISILSWLMQHEQLHYGKLMIYLAQIGIERPKSFKEMWGI
ncbi:hypothetical protein J4476_00510 [Candidatus Woesearchaeota archaeon]|nr:MAG: hypothetical protein QT09_C0005G0011 [archaeon GW2011_AR18]MBS3161165.1 hypothetical protein [Candidatus Woesearchaeota archaeon]HIH25965.1 DinB family protein [Nanoarchaeota archaeon]